MRLTYPVRLPRYVSDAITGIVRLLHILFGAAWLGSTFLWAMVVTPRILRTGPAEIRRPFLEATLPAVTNFFRVAAVMTILSGLTLVGMIWSWGSYFSAFKAPTYGVTLALGATFGITAAIVGLGFVAPRGHKLLETMRSMKGPPTPDQQASLAAQGKTIGILSMVAVTLITITIVCMAWATNAVR